MKVHARTIIISILALALIIFAITLIPKNEDELETLINESQNAEMNYDKLDDVVFDVQVSEVIQGDLIKKINANGMIKANNIIDVVSNLSSYIEKINYKEGSYVKKGDVLIELNQDEYLLSLQETESKMTDSKVEYGFMIKDWKAENVNEKEIDLINTKIKDLEEKYKRNQIEVEEYEKLKYRYEIELIVNGSRREDIAAHRSGLSSAIAANKKAKLNLSYTKIKAPYSGLIANINLSVGQKVSSGEKLFKLVDVNPLKLEANVLESDAPSLNIGGQVKIKINSIPSKEFYGRIVTINPIIDEETKTCKVTIELNTQDMKVKPGMFATADIQAGVFYNRLLIPKDALLIRDKRPLVFTIEDGLSKWKYIEIGEQNDEYVEVVSGLEKGEIVIKSGHYTLNHDAKVNVIK